MLAIKSKLAIARLIVIISGLSLLVYSTVFQKPSMYLNLATLLFTIAVFLAGFLEVTFLNDDKISASSTLSLAMVYILIWPAAIVGSVIAAVLSNLVKVRKFHFQNLLLIISKTSLIIFFTHLAFTAVGGKPVLQWGSLVSNPSLWLARIILPSVTGAVIYFVLSCALEQVFYSFKKGVSFIPVYLGALRTQATVFFTFSVISLLMAFMYQNMHFLSIILFSIPLMVTGHSFKLYLNIRKAYEDTIIALANTIEAQDQDKRGHAERVTGYCIDIARELGLYGKQLEEVSYAALLHDIGHLGFEAGTKAEEILADTPEEIGNKGVPLHALVGADILGQVDYLKSASGLVKYHHYPFQDVVKNRSQNAKYPIGARIIQTATEFDKIVNSTNNEEKLSADQALKKMKKDQGYVYDPKVLRALTSVLKKQGKLN